MSTRSSQPHRLFLPVVTPTSFPRDWRRSPMSWRQQGEQRQASVSDGTRWATLRLGFGTLLNFFPSASLSALRRRSHKHSLTTRSGAPPPLLRSREAKHPLGGAVWQRRQPPSAESRCTYQSSAICFLDYKAAQVAELVLLHSSALRGRRRCRLWWCRPSPPRTPRRRSEGACPVQCTRHPLCSWMKSQTGMFLPWHGKKNKKYIFKVTYVNILFLFCWNFCRQQSVSF